MEKPLRLPHAQTTAQLPHQALREQESANSGVIPIRSPENAIPDGLLGCGSLPAGVTCHFEKPSITLTANGVTNVQLMIDTNNPLGGGSTAMNGHPGGSGLQLAGLLLPLSGLFGLIFWRWRRRNGAIWTAALLLVLGAATMLATGCSGFSQSSAAPGAYVIQVTGVGVKSNISHYQNVTLNITR